MKINFRRHGDVNLHPISSEEFSKLKGLKKLDHDGSWILARGEATGSVHRLQVKNPANLEVFTDESGRMYFKLGEQATITHTHDHETITAEPMIYTQVPERELDHFADSVERKVVD